MNENYLIKHNSEQAEQINLPSFLTFNSNSSRFLPGSCFPAGLFTYQRTDLNQRDVTKEEEDDSGIQCSLPSDSSISTPDIINSIYSNNTGLDNVSVSGNVEQQSSFWLKVDFMSPSSFFYKDVDKPTNAAKLTYLPNRDHPVLYVEKGRVIELAVETNFCPPTNSFLKFDIYSLKGTREEPVYGASSEIFSNSSVSSSNLCFIQVTEEQKVSAYYLKSDDGFIAMIVPLTQSLYSFSVVFPFLNFKCQTSSKKIVFMRISVCNGSGTITYQKFQLVCCTSPNRDYKRHYEKLDVDNCNKVSAKKLKTKPSEGTTTTSSNVSDLCHGTQRSTVNDNPQYVIMTENYDIWKILHIVHQQLDAHFNTTKK